MIVTTEKNDSQDKRMITYDEAMDLLDIRKAGDEKGTYYVHTFRAAIALLGADHSLASVKESLKKHEDTIELAGAQARSMNHGVAIIDEFGPLFFETDKEKLDAFDPQ